MSLFLLGILNAQAAGAVGSQYELISETVLTGDVADIDITSIPQTHKHLKVIASLRAASTDANSGFTNATVSINNATISYEVLHIDIGSSTASASSDTRTDGWLLDDLAARGGNASSIIAENAITFYNYSGSEKKTIFRQGIASSNPQIDGGKADTTSAITSLQFYGGVHDYGVGTVIRIYGIGAL